MKNDWIRKIIGLILLVSLLTLPLVTPFQIYLSIPSQMKVFNSIDQIQLPNLGDAVTVTTTENSHARTAADIMPYAEESGDTEVIYTFSNIPLKKVDISVYDDYYVVPGGQSIGINLHTEGVLVVGHHIVPTEDGDKSPGEDANIKVGDSIIQINDQSIRKMEEVAPLVKQAGKNNSPLEIKLKRGNKTIETSLKPQLDKNDNDYRIGLYIRDSAAGIGTMTFYDPQSKKYGALGHIISDMDTRKPVEIHNGSIVNSTVKEIKKGENGIPGEKRAEFDVNDSKLGNITKNTPFGIFGALDSTPEKNKWSEPLPIALPSQVKEGKAQILTVIEGEEVEAFDVEIVNNVVQEAPATKGMIVKITDKRLLDATGGIVQGMSGSPIIQNGRLIGAVTHVFVNDPTSGYGVHIEWMLNEAGIDIYKQSDKAS
ncbi:stage IV sporulation protein B [Gracilibacillus ureilyticus]|uniref:Stage IV sporulation protein B n=1 Tax=Gracilibacillus ureilyticus TaxID=531814 RepID=A0A1H9LY28_9BACI|nr:SpoIVB peptidase [Gracilibacillus ureilyticus]SER15723.1 stage IV sporulation protein B [Gracilibacillus ureilyticus]